jgi:hypothetical protein
MAEIASLALIDASRGKPHERAREVVPGSLEIRESTAPPPASD